MFPQSDSDSCWKMRALPPGSPGLLVDEVAPLGGFEGETKKARSSETFC